MPGPHLLERSPSRNPNLLTNLSNDGWLHPHTHSPPPISISKAFGILSTHNYLWKWLHPACCDQGVPEQKEMVSEKAEQRLSWENAPTETGLHTSQHQETLV